jgi:hypothetical protein
MYLYNFKLTPERRFSIEQLLMFLSYISLLGLLNFHVFHISSFSTTHCMANQMLESFVLTQRDLYPSSHDLKAILRNFDKTQFFQDHADIFYLRIVDRGATYGLQNKSLYLDYEGKISMW